jgi:uncharacterized protein
MEKVSRYMVISNSTYCDDTGLRVRLVYGTRTAKIVCVLPAVAAALEDGAPGRIPEGLLGALRRAQIIVPNGDDELADILGRNQEASGDITAVQFMLLPTSYCNMGCSYCGQEHVRGRLGADHRDRVRARVLRAIGLPSTRKVAVDWFGAEPMMGYAVICDLAQDFVRLAGERDIEYTSTIVTNGSLLNSRKINTLIRECRVNQFDITLDGPADIHDVHRPLKAGGGSFWKIVRTIREAVDRPEYSHVGFDFRTNVDIHNQDSISRYIELMASLGFARPNVTFSIARVRPWGNDVSAIELSRQEFADRELAWMRLMQQHGLSFNVLPSFAKKVTCPAVHVSSELISGSGNIFSCTDHPLVPEAERDLALGHVSQNDLPVFRPAGEFDGWNDDIRQGKSWCRECVFLPTCGGSCPKAWSEGNPPCPGYKLNVQGRLDLAAARAGLRPVPAVAPR